jgi:hypothetical protein
MNNSDRQSWFTTKQLQERYNLGRQAIHIRKRALQIAPIRVGFRSYYSWAQVVQLDRLHDFIRSGGTIPEYLKFKDEESDGR